MVAVVDSVNFVRDYEEAKFLQETEESLSEDGERSIAELLVDQVEFADMILPNKIDLRRTSRLSSDYKSFKMRRAALWPGAPVTPPPG